MATDPQSNDRGRLPTSPHKGPHPSTVFVVAFIVGALLLALSYSFLPGWVTAGGIVLFFNSLGALTSWSDRRYWHGR